MVKILVTGGTGLIGKSLNDLVNETNNENEWNFIGSKDLNLLNYNEVEEYLNKLKPEIVIHLAARVGGLYDNMNNNEKMYVENMEINLNIIKACESAKVRRFIPILSTCIFPDKPPSLPLTEDMIHSGPPHNSNEGYAYAKRMLELHSRLSNMETICLIPTNIYGKYDNFNIRNGHVIPALIHKCYKAKKTNKPFIISGSGNALRQFIYNEDVAKIIIWATELKEIKHEAYICCPNESEEISIKSIAELIAKNMNYYNIIYDISYPEGQYKKTASNEKLKNAMDIEFSNFEEKLKNTIEWFINNYETVRK